MCLIVSTLEFAPSITKQIEQSACPYIGTYSHKRWTALFQAEHLHISQERKF